MWPALGFTGQVVFHNASVACDVLGQMRIIAWDVAQSHFFVGRICRVDWVLCCGHFVFFSRRDEMKLNGGVLCPSVFIRF